MGDDPSEGIRRALELLPIRNLDLQVYASNVRWWADFAQQYADADKASDEMRASGRIVAVLEEFESICHGKPISSKVDLMIDYALRPASPICLYLSSGFAWGASDAGSR
ncbi:hypothetical protein [Rhizobium favelukesii]|nr:hypothetical protein [Rhizobium favelukesii]